MSSRDEALTRLTGAGGPFELRNIADQGEPPLRAYAGGPRTLREVLLASRNYGDREFLVFEDERITYEDHFRRVARLAHWLAGRGVGKGDRIGVCMRNYPEWSIAFFACQAIGAVAVTLNAWWTGQELVHGITDSGCSWVVLDEERDQRLASVAAELPPVRVLVTRSEARRDGVSAWSEVMDSRTDEGLPEVALDPTDIASIMYTSGTTGLPKGALHTQRNHITNIQNTLLGGAVAQLLAPPAAEGPEPSQPSALQTFPFFHIGGLSGLYISIVTGSKLVLMYKWDVEQALELIARERVQAWSAVPTLVRQILEHPRAATDALASVVSIASGGAPVPADLIEQVGTMFERRVAPGNGYGATETTSAVIVNSGVDYLARPRSVGRPVATADVRIVDEAGRDCDVEEIGELWIRGPNVFAGYWNRPEETAASFQDGWFKSGDIGYRDAEGFYYVVDRKKDVIIRAGENVYCAEVEGALHEHPDIVDVALIGLPHRSLGEEVAAVVERRPGAGLTEADVQAHVAERLARYNVPTKVYFIDEPLPRTATGKVLKRELKQRYGG